MASSYACAVNRTAAIMAANREDVSDSSSALALMSFLSDPATLVSLGVIAAGTAYYLLTRPTPVKPPIPLDNQSLELPVSKLRAVERFAVLI